jgi:hypothetical protein
LSNNFFSHGIDFVAAALAENNYKNNGGNRGFGRKERPSCSHCGMMDHTVEKCYKIHGYALRQRLKRPTTNQVMNAASSVNSDGSVPNAVNPFPMSQE